MNSRKFYIYFTCNFWILSDNQFACDACHICHKTAAKSKIPFGFLFIGEVWYCSRVKLSAVLNCPIIRTSTL